MALGGDRQVIQTDVRFAASGAMERGGIASFVPWVNGIVYYAAGSGQSPAGLVLDDIESMNYFTHPEYLQRNVSPLGAAVGLATQGEFMTDMLDSANSSYKAGDTLYLFSAGKITNLNGYAAVTDNSAVVGVCLSAKNSNGYIRMRLKLERTD